jgi:hypothetical protein
MDFLELFAALAAFAGLAGLVAEIWFKDAALFSEIARDVRGFAEPSRQAAFRPVVARVANAPPAANDRGIMQAA